MIDWYPILVRFPAFVVAFVLVIVLALLSVVRPAHAREEMPPCGLPVPALLAVLPDGSTVPVSRVDYRLDARRIELVGDPRIACSGFE
jgi:hypothetical protein